MWNEPEHWRWLGMGIGLILFFFLLYYCMIKSAEHVRLRLYPPDTVLPLLDNELTRRKSTTEKPSEDDTDKGEDWQSPA
jgi:hypothetical protein